MDTEKTLKVYKREKFGYKQYILDVRTSLTIDPYLNIPEEFISNALCNQLREFVNSSKIANDVESAVYDPLSYQNSIFLKNSFPRQKGKCDE